MNIMSLIVVWKDVMRSGVKCTYHHGRQEKRWKWTRKHGQQVLLSSGVYLVCLSSHIVCLWTEVWVGVGVTRMVFICPSLPYWAFWRHWIWLQVCCYLQLTQKSFLLSIHNTVCKVVPFGLLVSFLKWELRGMPQSVYPKCARDVDCANPSSRTGVPQELTALHRKMKNRNAFTYCVVSRALFLKQWDWAERERHVAQVVCGTGCTWHRSYVAQVACGSSVLMACHFTLKTVHQFQVSG